MQKNGCKLDRYEQNCKNTRNGPIKRQRHHQSFFLITTVGRNVYLFRPLIPPKTFKAFFDQTFFAEQCIKIEKSMLALSFGPVQTMNHKTTNVLLPYVLNLLMYLN